MEIVVLADECLAIKIRGSDIGGAGRVRVWDRIGFV